MTYLLIVLPFAAVTVAVTLVSAVRPGFRRRLVASVLAACVLVILTVAFDNLMIALGLFTYPAEHISGLRIGAAPIEDLSYPVCAAFLVPALFALLRRRESP